MVSCNQVLIRVYVQGEGVSLSVGGRAEGGVARIPGGWVGRPSPPGRSASITRLRWRGLLAAQRVADDALCIIHARLSVGQHRAPGEREVHASGDSEQRAHRAARCRQSGRSSGSDSRPAVERGAFVWGVGSGAVARCVRTSAVSPARIATGKLGHASTTARRSGSERADFSHRPPQQAHQSASAADDDSLVTVDSAESLREVPASGVQGFESPWGRAARPVERRAFFIGETAVSLGRSHIQRPAWAAIQDAVARLDIPPRE